jgi:5'-methylthioadenosine phosphorylase
VTQEEVFRVFAENSARLREVVIRAIEELPLDRDCPCPHALDGLTVPFTLP